MQRTFSRLRTGFLLLFALFTGAVVAHQLYVVQPERRCTEGGGWWDSDQRVCATPIDISRITRRPRGEPRPAPGQAPAATPPASPPAATARP
jgi:hypothetical protein